MSPVVTTAAARGAFSERISKPSDVLARTLPDEYFIARLAEVTKHRTRDGIRSMLPLEQTPGLLSLLAGKPHASTFPITSLSFTVRDPSHSGEDTHIQLTQKELDTGLQYGMTVGLPAFLEWLYNLQKRAHGRDKGEGWTITSGNGSQDLIYKAAAALVNPGDPVLIEAPVYAGILPIFQSMKCDLHEVQMDEHGIDPASLRAILENWPSDKPRPKVLYTVPYGANPTGATATLERRLEVLEMSREYDFLILEDDPYHYLYYGAHPRPPSYFALERDQPEVGRVVRFDSLSKVLASGLRIGFVSGPTPIITAINSHTNVSNLQPNSLAQVLAYAVLSRWGYDGFFQHTDRVAEFYREKRDVFERAMHRHLDGLAEWSAPEAGMFYWFKLLTGDNGGDGDSNDVIRTKAFERGVLALPGTVFYPSSSKSAYVRASFSQLGEEEVNEALRRLREAILDSR